MIKKVFRKIVDRLFLRKIDDIKVQKGMLFEKYLQTNLKNIKSLDEVYFKVFSQDTEDGIIQYCLTLQCKPKSKSPESHEINKKHILHK